jgi:hypothetical protein
MDFLFYVSRKKYLKEYQYNIYKMNIYYTNPFFDKLPNEIQNHICSFLPPHPIKDMIKKCCCCSKVRECHNMKWNSFLCKSCVYYIGFGNMKGRRIECDCSNCFNTLSNSFDENASGIYGDDFFERIGEVIDKIIIENSVKLI